MVLTSTVRGKNILSDKEADCPLHSAQRTSHSSRISTVATMVNFSHGNGFNHGGAATPPFANDEVEEGMSRLNQLQSTIAP